MDRNRRLITASVQPGYLKCRTQGKLPGCLFEFDHPDKQCHNKRQGTLWVFSHMYTNLLLIPSYICCSLVSTCLLTHLVAHSLDRSLTHLLTHYILIHSLTHFPPSLPPSLPASPVQVVCVVHVKKVMDRHLTSRAVARVVKVAWLSFLFHVREEIEENK